MLNLTKRGRAFVEDLGIDISNLSTNRRPLCKSCLDWSARRSHLAGALGTALLDRFYDLGWAAREPGTRIVNFTKNGEVAFLKTFGG